MQIYVRVPVYIYRNPTDLVLVPDVKEHPWSDQV